MSQAIVRSHSLPLLRLVESLGCFCCIPETVFDDQSPLKFDACWILWQQSLLCLPSVCDCCRE